MIISDLDYWEAITKINKVCGGSVNSRSNGHQRMILLNSLNTAILGIAQASYQGRSNGTIGASTDGSSVAETTVNNGGIVSVSGSEVSSSATDTIS